MSIPLSINGAVFEYPQDFDESWGPDATGWAQAVTNGMLQMQGGSFPLTANVNFGPNFGLLAQYFETRSALPATIGTVRLSSADAGVVFRNHANSGNLVLTTDTSDNLTFNGLTFGTNGTVNSGTANQLAYYPASTNAVSGLTAITASRALVSDTNGLPVASSVTTTTLAFLDATSSVQTQINSVSTIANAALPKTGGTMSGSIAMGSNKITGLTSGSGAQDAVAFTQLSSGNAITAGGITNATITTTQVASNTLTGSTANNGGSAGNMAQGTISTPDFRANAVTQTASSGLVTSTHGTDLTTVSITTVGGKVLLLGTAEISVTASSNNAGVSLAVTEGSTGILGGETLMNLGGGITGGQQFGLSVAVIVSPSAGSHTYNLSYIIQNGSFGSAPRYSLQAIELRA